MDVICIIDVVEPDNLSHRERCLEEVERASAMAVANLTVFSIENLDFRKTIEMDTFYHTDMAIVDMSIRHQRSALFYHLGLRESFGMKQNIILHNDIDTETTLQLKEWSSTGSYTFIPYRLADCGACLVTDAFSSDKSVFEPGVPISVILKELLNGVGIQTKANTKEIFLSDLENTKKNYRGENLRKKLFILRERLNDPEILSDDIIYNMLISFRDLQDYDSMIRLVEDIQAIPNTVNVIQTPKTRYLYPFALKKRDKPGDGEKALEIIKKELENEENHTSDMCNLCGSIYKDQIVKLFYVDNNVLENAIYWCRKGFELQPNEYSGINLATLLVIDGNEFHKCEELQHIGLVLNNLIGKKGRLKSLKNYWDVATYFEISVLLEDYRKAIQAADCMFQLKPLSWELKTTVDNILLINKFRRKYPDAEDIMAGEKTIFNFWMDYFVKAAKTDIDDSIRFPVLIFEPSKEHVPCYVNVNLGAEEKSIRFFYLRHSEENNKNHDWLLYADMIKCVNLHKKDDRCLFLHVNKRFNEFIMYFPSLRCRQRFFDLIVEIKKGQREMITNVLNSTNNQIEFEYELDDARNRIVLGQGCYGVVYRARYLKTQIIIAVKEIPEKDSNHVQPLHEIVKNNCRLDHRNIVRYFGSMSQDGFFKIFMEEVPGESLFSLLRSKGGWWKKNEPTIIFYTRQMLEGLKYLHDQKIVHQNFQSDNVLINMYDGVLKLADFGTYARILGLCSNDEKSKRMLLYTAPEVIDKNQTKYDFPADIWSLGYMVVEMATGKTPFAEFKSTEGATSKMGFHEIHSAIPVELSEQARHFIARCFTFDPDRRPTAANLLEDPFMTQKKISHQKSWSRSVSKSI